MTKVKMEGNKITATNIAVSKNGIKQNVKLTKCQMAKCQADKMSYG